jgi:hypothetical protein
MGRPKVKYAVEDYRALNITSLRRDGVLVPGYSCNWQWSRAGEVVASIGLAVESRYSLRLHYQSRSQGAVPEQHNYAVGITWTPCHLGGERPWFNCPGCDRRVGKLYSSTHFVCRHCLKLNYATQQASKRDRALNRSWTLRRRLGCDAGMYVIAADCIPRPKGMHRKTFARHIERLERVERQALGDLEMVLEHLGLSATRIAR